MFQWRLPAVQRSLRRSASLNDDRQQRVRQRSPASRLDTMGPLARNNLSHFTDAEIAALYSYLHAMPAAARN